ncbi:MAG: hypothetical protein VX009_02790 [Pseudomonadota bacterium]|nr:hypothetical protein [Pseudomonadota bacterium]
MNFEIENYKKSGISYLEFRKKKCYKKAFVIFQNSKLCTHDPHLCAQDFAVEEIFYFQRYRKLLLNISEICAEGYPIEYDDAAVVKGNSKKDVKEFIDYLKNKKKVNYNNSSEKVIFENKNVNTRKQTGAHGALPSPKIKKSEVNNKIDELRSNEIEIKKREESLITLEKKLILEKELLQEEKKLFEQKKRLKKLEAKILESENDLKKKRNEID